MGHYLLDTHTAVWFFNGDKSISKTAKSIILAHSSGFTILPIKTAHLTAFETLPLIHRDPFDRLLVATTLAEQMTLVTRDENIPQYTVPQIW